MVGTPNSAVHCSSCTVSSTLSGSNASSGNTMVAPWLTQPRTPITIPKQWYSGTGMHKRSLSVNFIVSETKYPLFRILKWVRVAPLGNPVVPLVNCMLIGSSGCSKAAIDSTCCSDDEDAACPNSANRYMPGLSSSPRQITVLSEGIFSACRLPASQTSSSGVRLLSMLT